MSLKEIRKLSKGKRIDLTELPEQLTAKVLSWRFDKDRMGRDCLIVDLITKNEEILTQKYTSLHINDLSDCIEALGFDHIDELKKAFFVWKLKPYRIGNPRLLPMEKA